MMLPVYQNRFGKKPGKKKGGNCFQASVASLFELRLEEVPDFCNDYQSDWYDHFILWLRKRGYSAVHIVVSKKLLDSESFKDCLMLVSGKSPRGVSHTVIYRGAELCHDPHKMGGGVEPSGVDLIFPMNPMRKDS